MLAFIWFTVVAAIISFSIGKWVPTIGAFMRSVLLGFFTISVVIYAIKNGIHDTFGGHAFLPSYAIFIAAVPVLIFNYVGFELPSAAGEEMKDPQRDVPLGVPGRPWGPCCCTGFRSSRSCCSCRKGR